MSIYTISDLHLSFGENKPMDVFGENWKNHEKKIKENWEKKVKEEDVVILPGDFSWAMYLEETYKDFEYLNSLPGKKILLKGNHDYWWTTLSKMKNFLIKNNFENINFLQNNSYEYEDKIIAGTRGWGTNNSCEDKKIIDRELLRLELSIKDGITKFGENKDIIIFMHFPPFIDERFIKTMNKYKVRNCIYGHLHGENAHKEAREGKIENITYKLVSSDYIKFNLECVND